MPTPLRERKHLRRFSQPWFFVSLVTLAIAISYFDRQALPVAISAIERTIPISDARFAVLQASFLAAYALLYAGGGKFLDVIGTRAGFAISMAWWTSSGITGSSSHLRLNGSSRGSIDLVCCSRSMAIHELIRCKTHRTYVRGGNYSLCRRARSPLIQPLNPGPGIGTWGTRPPPANFQAAFF
jgi:hypothetical protein